MSFNIDLSTALEPKNIPAVFNAILLGEAEPAQVAAFLTALHETGETAEQITAAAHTMRTHMKKVILPPNAADKAIDVCGTGGDGLTTLNISTAVAFVAAASGAVVAKHGNRAQSSSSGSADLLEALGIRLDDGGKSLNQLGIGFMFAQNHHPAMKFVAPIRQKLGFRTIFNLLGPLCNPAGVRRQLLGVFDKKWLVPLAESLRELGSTHAWVVCGADGMDEITLTSKTSVAALKNGTIEVFELDSRDFGFALVEPKALQGGAPADNKHAFLELLAGKQSPYHDIVVLNSAAALVVAGIADSVEDGITKAQQALEHKTAKLLEQWIKVSNEK